MAASPMSFFLLLMAATFVVPFIVAIRMPNLRSLLTFALVMFAVQFALATIAAQFADTALLKDEAQVFARFFLWSALGLGSAAGAVFRWIWLARRERRFHLPENVRSGGQFLRNWPAGKDDGVS